MLAGVSTDYYARLERGRRTGVSNSVLEAVAEALHLDEAERGHPCDLARVANTTPPTRRTTGQQVRDGGGSQRPSGPSGSQPARGRHLPRPISSAIRGCGSSIFHGSGG